MYHRHGNRFGHTRWYSYVMYVKRKLLSVCLEIVLVLAQDRCTVCAIVPQAWKSFWAHQMVLLGEVGQVEADFGLFGYSVNLSARWVSGLRRMYHRHGNQFGLT
jgi:hypothetical protein